MVAVKFCLCLVGTFAVDGDTVTEIAPATMVMVADDDLVASEREVAVSVTVAGDGTSFGAV